MREIHGVDDEQRLHRRWFHGEYFDLFVWQDEAGTVARFERAGAGLPAAVRREVQARIREFAARAVSRRSAYRRAGWQQRNAGA